MASERRMEAGDVLDVLRALEAAGIDVSVEGGWGVDALLRRQTRDHADLDLAVAIGACEEAAHALEPLGFRHDPAERPALPARFVLRDSGVRQVDFHPLVFDEHGNGWQQLGDGGWLLHAAAFLWTPGVIDGTAVRCIAPELQLSFRLGYRWGERDRHDLSLLASEFGIPLPPEHSRGVAAVVPLLSDGVVVLDEFTDADLEAHVAGEDEEHARRFGWYPRRSTIDTARAAFAKWREDWHYGGDTRTFAVRKARTHALVGGCQLRLRDQRMAELSYWTVPQHRGKGFARRAVRLACSFAFGGLGVDRIEAYVEPDNLASQRVVEAAGFVEEGLLREREVTYRGDRRDMVLFALLRHDLDARRAPSPIREGGAAASS